MACFKFATLFLLVTITVITANAQNTSSHSRNPPRLADVSMSAVMTPRVRVLRNVVPTSLLVDVVFVPMHSTLKLLLIVPILEMAGVPVIVHAILIAACCRNVVPTFVEAGPVYPLMVKPMQV
ncbi:hypothetical protein B566_EDAN000747 [Ephemera danica]|nr:hypothetical protein B566_EDAN000747 [Ephemera danica]